MINYKCGLSTNIHVVHTDKITGEVTQEYHVKNTITDVDKIIDLIQGSVADHLDANSDLKLIDSSNSTIKTITSMRSGFPTVPSSASVDFGWEDLSVDVYTVDDMELHTSGAAKVAESLVVGFGAKAANENVNYNWDITFTGADAFFDDAGMTNMLKCVIGTSTQHWDGTEGSNNMTIDVYDGDPGSEEFADLAATAATVRTGTTIQWIFTKENTAVSWQRVEIRNNAAGVRIYNDKSISRNQQATDDLTYKFKITFTDT